MTSANVTNYTIRLNGEEVGKHSQHAYCKTTWGELLKFTPHENHTIQAWWYDEEEEYHEGEEKNLLDFINNLKASKAKFDTWEDIKKGMKKS